MTVHTVTDNTVPNGDSGPSTIRLPQSYTPKKRLQITVSGPYVKEMGAPAFFQILNGQEVWSRCTPMQRELLRGLRVEINDRKKRTNERYAVRSKIEAPARTIASLARKGVCDEEGHITMLGAYGALWGPNLEELKKKQKATN